MATGKRSKHRNVPITIDGIWFQSTHEGNTYRSFKMQKQAGVVTELRLQVPFPYVGRSGKVLFRYRADFVVRYADGREVVYDAKGQLTAMYKLKKKLIEDQHGIKIMEIYNK